MAEPYATIGAEPAVSMEEVSSVYHAKIGCAHPDGKHDTEERTKRLNLAYEALQKTRGVKG